jgi:hypothetical protein
MRTNQRLNSRRRTDFQVQNSAIREQNLQEEPDKTASHSRESRFSRFLGDEVLFCSCMLPKHSPRCPQKRFVQNKVSYIPLSGICGIFGGPPPAFWRSTFGVLIIKPLGGGGRYPHPRHAQLHTPF